MKLMPGNGATPQDTYDDLHRSYGRCLHNGAFIERFYELFLASHPDVPAAFANTDFNQQRRKLRRALTTSIMFAGGSDSVRASVDRMAEVHSRHGRVPVKPHLYDHWLESLVTAIREHDPELTPQLESRWREAMTKVTRHFIKHY